MTRVILANDVAQLQDQRTGRIYGGNTPGRVFDVPDHLAKDVKAAGGAMCSLTGSRRRGVGYRCTTCGFESYIRTCSRCGGACERE
jgi:lipopolysaccharide biosynthesis regulator YciM